MKQPRSRLRRGGLLTVAAAAALLAVCVATRHWRSAWLGDAWQQQLAEATDEEAPRLLRRIAATGDEAIPMLAASLASRRPAVSAAAEQALREQLRQWDRLGVSRSTPKVGILADALARRRARYGPSARRVAAQLATIILRWPADASLVDREKLVADCEAVIRSAAPDSQNTDPVHFTADGATGDAFDTERPLDQQRQVAGALEPFGDPLAAAHRLPGGGLPIDGLNEDASAIPIDAPVPADAPSPHGVLTTAPRRVAPDLARALGTYQGRRGATDDAASTNFDPTPAVGIQPPADQPPPVAAPIRSAAATPPELFAQLRSSEPQSAEAARAELSKQGFGREHLQLAWHLTDPDPRVRQEWLSRLPSLAGIDAAPWLLWLAEDSDAEVRLSAITMLATSADPHTLRRIQQLASDDVDPRIRHVAERLGQAGAARRR